VQDFCIFVKIYSMAIQNRASIAGANPIRSGNHHSPKTIFYSALDYDSDIKNTGQGFEP
jgi:hypothetical protein